MELYAMTLETRLRVTVNGLFVDSGDVLLIHQMTLPEIDCLDLPGGGLEAEEPVLDGLRREIQEETGIIGLWTNLKQKMDERAIRGEKISDMRNRSTDDLGVRK
jgi:ADP-ribose pyrophosphatase YjhB (NUDIX family)